MGARLAQFCRFLGQGQYIGYMQQARSEGCHAGETCQGNRDKWRLTPLQVEGKQKPAIGLCVGLGRRGRSACPASDHTALQALE